MQLGAFFLVAVLLMTAQRKRNVPYLLLACTAFLALCALAACGGSSPPPPPTLQPPPAPYPFTVNAAVSGGAAKTIDLILVVD